MCGSSLYGWLIIVWFNGEFIASNIASLIDGLGDLSATVGLSNFLDLYGHLFSVDYRDAVSHSLSADTFGTPGLNSRLGEFLRYILMVVMMMILWVLLIIGSDFRRLIFQRHLLD